MRENRPRTILARGAVSGSRKKRLIDTMPAGEPNQRQMAAKWAASAAIPRAVRAGTAAAWVPRLPATTAARAAKMAAWIVHAVFSGLPPRDTAKARERKANRPIPRASRAATDWTYEEAARACAAEFPSSPVARAKRPAMETIRPTFKRTGKARP